MVGQGVLRECLLDSEVESVLAIVRSATGQRHAKLQELVRENFFDFSDVAPRLAGYDACFFCLGVSAAGMSEADYQRVTYDVTLAAAKTLVECNPAMTFIYVSGAGTDGTERGRTMWARVKGRTENALSALPFRGAYMFRPAVIRPGPGIRSKTKSYRILYGLFGPLLPLFKALFPGYVATTGEVGLAMLEVAKHGAAKRVLESRDIIALGRIR